MGSSVMLRQAQRVLSVYFPAVKKTCTLRYKGNFNFTHSLEQLMNTLLQSAQQHSEYNKLVIDQHDREMLQYLDELHTLRYALVSVSQEDMHKYKTFIKKITDQSDTINELNAFPFD